MSAMGQLMAIKPIACYFDNVKVHELDGGSNGLIGQKYMDSVVRRVSADLSGWSLVPFIRDLARNANPQCFGSYDTIAGPGSAMLPDQAIDLSLLFDDLYTNFDPRCAGREVRFEIVLRDIPPTIGGIHGALLVYSVNGAGTTDTRQLWGWDNVRLEIECQNYPRDPFLTRKQYVHTFMNWSLASLPVDFSTEGSVSRWMLGQTHRRQHGIRRLVMWMLCIPGLNDGLEFANHTSVFRFTNNNFMGGRNALQLCSYKFMQNGEDIIDADDPVRKQSNSIDMQNTCYGNVKLHPHNDLNSSNLWDYSIAGAVV